ncbi:MAG: hypothetical protein ACE5KA_03125 [Nitrososphaerales archaeon]
MDTVLEHELVNKTTNLLSILSKKDALTIFLLAKDGLKAETDTPERIGLTRKQYYTRLKQLVDTGLVDKSGDIYTHTTLGAFVHQNHLVGLLDQVRNLKQMKMIDALKRARQFSENDISAFVGKVAGKTLASSALPSSTILWTYEDMVSTAVERINFAESEILLSSRFTNEMIINAMIRKANAGLDVKVVADSDLVKRFIKSASDQLQVLDKNSLERLNVVGNPWYPAGSVQRRYTVVPFSFILFDGKEAGVELVDAHDPGKFGGCMLVKDEMFCREMRTQFNKLWGIASDNLNQLLEMSAVDIKPKI